MESYSLTLYVRPKYLDWTIDGVLALLEMYGVNVHDMQIGKANRCNPFGVKAHELAVLFTHNNPKVFPYIFKRLNKEIGILKWG